MLQRTYFVSEKEELNSVLSEVSGLSEYTRPESVLVVMMANQVPKAGVTEYTEIIRKGLPGASIAGVSVITSNYSLDKSGISISFCFFRESAVRVLTYAADSVTEDDAAEAIKRIISETGNVRAVMTFPCGFGYDFSELLKRISENNFDTAFFGTHGATTVPLGEGSHIVFTESDYAVGSSVINDGIVCVLISGESLSVRAKYMFGWRPFGKPMRVTGIKKLGGSRLCVSEIDGQPAIEIYRKYLKVEPDEYFLDNACEFPMVVKKHNTVIGKVPYFSGENGEMFLVGDLDRGDELKLSFAYPGELLEIAGCLSREMEEFGAEALFLNVCFNRFLFFKEDRNKEVEYFRRYFKDLVFYYGGYEILRYQGVGGIYNSALVAVGLKEGEDPSHQNTIEVHFGSKTGARRIPTYEKLLTFINTSAKELENALEAAEKASRDKSIFLANMSHEIRTQLNAILGMDEMIIRESSDEKVLGFAEDVKSAGNCLLGIVNDVLDSSKIEDGKLNIVPGEYETIILISDLIGTVKKAAADKGIVLNLEVDPVLPRVLYGDDVRIRQVILNLLSNAVKYTEKGSISVSFNCRECDPVEKEIEPENSIILSVCVKDTGIGIKKENINKLFIVHERSGEKETKGIAGTGLGLPITGKLLRLMGSRLNVESEYGKGSTFSFDIVQRVVDSDIIGDYETARDELLRSRKKNKDRFTAPDANILVVDDTQMNLTVIRNLLRRTKIRIDTVTSGRECLEVTLKNKYDLILMDHRMPEMDGVQTFKRIRKDKENLNRDTPVIALTANIFTNSRDMYLNMGFEDYISKPVNPGILESALLHYLPEEKVNKEEDFVEEEDWVEDGEVPKIMRESPMISVEMGIQNCGSPEYYMETVRIYLDSAPDNREKIEKYFEKGNIPDYTTKVHALKSSSRIIGVKNLGDLAEKLEKAGNEKDIPFIAENTPELLKLYKELTDILDTAVTEYYSLDEEDDGDKEEITPDKLNEAYSAIRETAQMFDYDSMSMVMGMLDKYRIPDSEKEKYETLKKAFRDADWDEINNVLGYG
ncbi:MAG: response regulator [Lachnospiraceae bacterium]|nr:response regulator [Lachnospiraceae bacterium]